MKARSSDTSTQQNGGDGLAMSSTSNGHLHDLSILRKPIQTSITGFHEAMKAYNDGTDEIRKLLANECDIIYECKTCRNIFRSLANFISHKRIYCKNQFNSMHHFDFRRHNGCIDQDISTIIQAEYDHLLWKKNDTKISNNSSSSLSSVNGGGGAKEKNQDKDLGSIIDRLVRREQTNRLMNLNDFYDQVNQNLTQDDILDRKNKIKSNQSDADEQQQQDIIADKLLKLDKIATNNNVAVYQTIKSNTDIDDIKKEVNEVHDLMEKENIVLGPDGKIVAADIVDSAAGPLATKLEYACEICSNKFSTEKTLKLHIKAKHIPSTFVYPCPSCSQTFLQPSAVIRHLNNDHKKSMRRIRLMRDAIYRRRTRIDEVPIKGPSRELARLQTDKDRADAQAKLNSAAYNNWLGDGDSMNVMTSICANCGKSFERRAALLTHTKTCSAKNSKSSNENSSMDDTTTKNVNAEDSQNSLDDFMRMLNREKQIQAQAENEIAIESNRASPIISEPMTSQSNSMDADALFETKSTETLIEMESVSLAAAVFTNESAATKNKRKRTRTRKADIEQMPTTVDDEMSYWNMDEDGNLKIVKTDPINGEIVINVTSSEIESFNKSSASSPPTSPPLIVDDDIDIETTTDCTICKRQFANLSNLRRHVAMFHYRQKKFGCQMCDARAFRKIDIVNHLQAIHSIGNEKQEASKLVIVINIDKNKFSEEKNKAVQHAICKKRDKDNRLKNESLVMEIVQQQQQQSTLQLLDNDVSTTSASTDIDIDMIADDSKLMLNDEIAPVTTTTSATIESNQNICVDFELAIDSAAAIPTKIKFDSEQNSSVTDILVPSSIDDQSSSFTPPNSVTKDSSSKMSRNSSNSSLSPDDYKPTKRKSASSNKSAAKNVDEKLSRNSSNSSLSDECKPTRRPVRKRIKMVNKDFVYDLSNLLKKEAEAYKEQHIHLPFGGRTNKRKSQVVAASHVDDIGASKEFTAPVTSASTPQSTSILSSSVTAVKCILGAAKEMAKIAVNSSRACYNKIPEMPIERSIIPAKIIQMRQRSESIANLPNWSLSANNSSKKICSSNNRSLSIDKLLTNITSSTTKQRRRRSAKKTTLPVSPSFSNSLLAATIATSNLTISQDIDKTVQKSMSIKDILDRKIFESNNSKLQSINSVSNGNGTTKTTTTSNKSDPGVVTTCPTEEEFERYMSAANRLTETESLHYIVPKSAAASLAYTNNYDNNSNNCSNVVDAVALPSPIITSPITPTKRITLLQRLAENKSRKLQQQQQQQESLLKTNLYENGGKSQSTTSSSSSSSAKEQSN